MKFFQLLFLFSLCFVSQSQSIEKANKAFLAGDYQIAFEQFEAASKIFLEKNQPNQYVDACKSMVQCQLQNGYPFYAKSIADRVFKYVAENIKEDVNLLAESKTLIGLSLINLGRNEDALNELKEAEKLFSAKNESLSDCYNALGIAYWNNGNIELALQYHEQALELRLDELGNQSIKVADSYNNLGLVLIDENPQQASIYFKRALRIYTKTLGEKNQKTANTKTNMAFTRVALTDYDEAIYLLVEIKELYEKEYPSNHPNQAFILSSLGRVKLAEGALDESLELQTKALQIYLDLYGEKHPEVANTYILIGDVYKEKSAFSEAIHNYHYSIYANLPNSNTGSIYDLPVISDYLNADILLTSLEAKAIAFEAFHFEKSLNIRDILGAINTYELCDQLITDIRRKRLSEQDKLRLGATAKRVYESGIELSLIMSNQTFNKTKYLKKAFAFNERSKSAVLLEAITESNAKKFAGIPENLLVFEDSLRDNIAVLEQKLVLEKSENQELKNNLFEIKNAYLALIRKLEKEYPEYYQLKYNQQLITIDEIQDQLNANEAQISYFLGEDQLFIFSITKKKIRCNPLPLPEDFNKKIIGLRNALKYQLDNALLTQSNAFYKLLIPSFSKNISKLIIIPDGPISTIPFESFVDENGQFLIENYYISYDYSSSLAKTREVSESSAGNALLMAPISFQVDQQLSDLPGTKDEIRNISYLFESNSKKAEVRLASQASEEIIKNEDLKSFQMIHLATHGEVNESEPSLSRIILSSGIHEDGNLYAGEIYNLSLNADLITLSACETGLGKITKGEGIVGLSRALQFAGANNMILSLWKVSDQSTAELMVSFYSDFLQNDSESYAQSLRNAKMTLIRSEKWNKPYYWSPFILVGR